MAKNSPIPSAEEGLIPDRLISNETVNKRAAQATYAARATARTSVKAVRQTGVAAKVATRKTGQGVATATRQATQKIDTIAKQRTSQPALGSAQKQEQKIARNLDRQMLASRNHAAQAKTQQVQQKGRAR